MKHDERIELIESVTWAVAFVMFFAWVFFG